MSLKDSPQYYHEVLKRIPPRAQPPFEDDDQAPHIVLRRVTSAQSRGQAVLIEDGVDHVADRRQLEERAQHRDSDVLLEVGALP